MEIKIDKLKIPHEYKFLIEKLVGKISEFQSILKIYLFGSLATGEVKNSSDIDLAVIVSDRTEVNRKLRLKIVDAIEDMIIENEYINIPYDIAFFNDNDFERNREISISVVKEIVKEGKLLYERKLL